MLATQNKIIKNQNKDASSQKANHMITSWVSIPQPYHEKKKKKTRTHTHTQYKRRLKGTNLIVCYQGLSIWYLN